MIEITPEIQAQLDEQKKQCVFCKILIGETESKKVYSDKFITGILDINPGVPGHMVLLPNEHYPILPYLPTATFKHIFGIMPQLIGAAKSAMIATGATVFIANGGIAGQQSPHFIVHLLPRERGDKVDLYAFSKKQVLDENKLKEANQLLAKNIPIMMQNHFA